MCGWCVDGLTFSPLFLYSISIRFLLLITNRSQLIENHLDCQEETSVEKTSDANRFECFVFFLSTQYSKPIQTFPIDGVTVRWFVFLYRVFNLSLWLLSRGEHGGIYVPYMSLHQLRYFCVFLKVELVSFFLRHQMSF